MLALPEKASTILLADADPESMAALRTLLESWNYRIETFTDGLSAFQRLNSPESPSMAILDYDLPQMKGLEVIVEVRRRARQHTSWLMLMSSSPDSEKVSMATSGGADDFLLKPVNEFDLLVRLRTAERVQQLHRELQEQIDAVRFHASHDSLTGLLNREAMMRQLFQETDRVQRMRTPLTFMLLDLDKFSDVNLECDYATGDAVLKEFGLRLKRYLRSYDILGRCGEDEFLIGLPGCVAEQAASMAERLKRSVLEKPYHIHRDMLNITASIGIATSRGRSPLVVLREAERALGDAKLAGRNCIRCFGQHMEMPAPSLDPAVDGPSEPRLMRLP